MTRTYRKIPHQVTAWQFDCQRPAEFPDWVSEKVAKMRQIGNSATGRVVDFTLDSGKLISDGDWVIKSEDGKIYTCTNDIFDKIYEPVN